ncbi:hypothetical protein ZWY2020_002549 [Hordeum vulgare]|nr:hypothetical protein ZWY2020_002549 [Hordeum vulgare]
MMWGGMWSSGRHGGDDPERKRCIAADVWRKRFALRYTNRALEPVVSLLHRKGEEYDPRHAWLAYGAGSSSFAYRLRTPLSQVDVMLQKLEKEINDVDARIGNR